MCSVPHGRRIELLVARLLLYFFVVGGWLVSVLEGSIQIASFLNIHTQCTHARGVQAFSFGTSPSSEYPPFRVERIIAHKLLT